MSAHLAKAIKTRLVAEGVDDSITGGFHHGRPSSRAQMPYAIYTEVSHPIEHHTRDTEYSTLGIQWDVYVDTGEAEDASDLAELIINALVNADRDSSNTMTAEGAAILSARLTQNITVDPEGDEDVYRANCQMQIQWARYRDPK